MGRGFVMGGLPYHIQNSRRLLHLTVAIPDLMDRVSYVFIQFSSIKDLVSRIAIVCFRPHSSYSN